MIPGWPCWHCKESVLWYAPNELDWLAGSAGSSFHSHKRPVPVGSVPPFLLFSIPAKTWTYRKNIFYLYKIKIDPLEMTLYWFHEVMHYFIPTYLSFSFIGHELVAPFRVISDVKWMIRCRLTRVFSSLDYKCICFTSYNVNLWYEKPINVPCNAPTNMS